MFISRNLSYKAMILSLGLIGLIGCSSEDHSVSTLGIPTTLRQGETPLQAICGIQQEFRLLKKPVLSEVIYHPEETRRMRVDFGVYPGKLPAYYEYELHSHAQSWLKMHTSAELSVALSPLINDAKLGGEAAVIIAALASGRKFRTDKYGYHQSGISAEFTKRLNQSGYRSPARPGNWGPEITGQLFIPGQISLAFSTPKTRQETGEQKAVERVQTLNDQLSNFHSEIAYYENGMITSLIYGGSDVFNKVDRLDEWLLANPLPAAPDSQRHEQLIETWGREFVVLASFARGIPRGIAVYELGLHRYWPMLYSYTHSVKELHQQPRNFQLEESYRQAYRQEIISRVLEINQQTCGQSDNRP